MARNANLNECGSPERACAYALQILDSSEIPATEAHIASCPDCQREVENLRPVIDGTVWMEDQGVFWILDVR